MPAAFDLHTFSVLYGRVHVFAGLTRVSLASHIHVFSGHSREPKRALFGGFHSTGIATVGHRWKNRGFTAQSRWKIGFCALVWAAGARDVLSARCYETTSSKRAKKHEERSQH